MTAGLPFSDVERAIFLTHVENGMSVATAAEKVGFAPRTIKRHLRADESFREELLEAELLATGRVEDKLYRKATKGAGDLGAIKMWLANRAEPGRWVDERDRGAGRHGAPSSGPELIIGAMREMLTDGTTRETALIALSQVPLPEAIEVSATES